MCYVFWLQGSRDNMTILLVALDGRPPIDPEAVEREKNLDVLLEKHLQQLMQQTVDAAATSTLTSPGGAPQMPGIAYPAVGSLSQELDCNRLFNRLKPEDFESLLPPGGGILAKYDSSILRAICFPIAYYISPSLSLVIIVEVETQE